MASKVLLLSLAALPLVKSETVLGLYVFSRHGDRTPKALAPTNLTSLGAEEVYASGRYYRNKYVASDATSPILGLSRDTAALTQLTVTAPVDNVLQSSAQAFLQGLYPPAGSFSTQELRNDTNVTAPLSGYQYIPVNAVSTASSSSNSENNPWLQGGSGCDNAVVSSNNYLSSTEYKASFSQSADFYKSLLPVINSTFAADDASFKNAYAIFDYIHVATIHNQTIPASDLLTDETLFELKQAAPAHPVRRLRELRVLLRARAAARCVRRLHRRRRLRGVDGLRARHQRERQRRLPGRDDISVRFLFSNGSAADVAPTAYPLFGQRETVLPWATFVSEISEVAIGDTPDWCRVCGVTTGACASASTGSGSDSGVSATKAGNGNGISLPVAGVIGALVTLAVVLGAEALIYFLSGVTLVKKSTLAASVAATTPGTKA
ncbi:hypothetical protein CIB48_g7884 [Xylaria polymorpha]|nr:hypothetical protein CIB48_g7884 [Xylaria polymorpha]